MKKLFRRTVDTGIEHGTVTVLLGRDGYEVTTYRIDGAYEDSRHPKEVLFTNRLEEGSAPAEILRSMQWHIMMKCAL